MRQSQCSLLRDVTAGDGVGAQKKYPRNNSQGKTNRRGGSQCDELGFWDYILSWVVIQSIQGSTKALDRLREYCRQAQTDVVSKSRNKIHQTCSKPFS